MRIPVVLLLSFLSPIGRAQSPDRAIDLVDPFVGTGGHGHTFPGACVPNGLVQLSPDTRTDGYRDWDGCGGYHYSDSLIYGFSHTHLSGTGVADLCDVLVMPMSGGYSFDPSEYRSHFAHANEVAHTGYYSVYLDGPQADVELTATARVGMHRYTFRSGEDAFLVLDLRHRDKLLACSIQASGAQEVVGERRSSSWADDQHLFFCIRFDHPVLEHNGDAEKAAFSFGPIASLQVKVGISAVSIEGARANLEAEIPGWDFDKVREQAEEAWNAKLGKIEIQGGTPEQQRIFYTALYHCYVVPYVFNDVDGNYRGMDGAVHHADHNVYTVFSLWDTFRALHPLMTILEPEMTNDFIRTFLLQYQQGGKLPVWELWGNETNCMIGYHSVPVIADAYMKGIRGYDADLALRAMVASAMQDDPCLEAYRARGYISSTDCSESVSKTLEYAYDDWCIARMARAMGRDSLANAFQLRAHNWQNLFDPTVRFFQARQNGGFIHPFDPYEVNFHFTEANAWQYSLFVPQDIQGLAALLGGRDSLGSRLDALFTAHTNTTGRDQSDISGLIGQYAHGNEPSHHMAYLYSDAGRPADTRRMARRIMEELYHDAPDGLAGNEDCGQMSAWYVLSAMGFYPVTPASDRYVLGYPLFDEVRIHVNDSTTFGIQVDAANGPDGRNLLRRSPGFQVPDHITHADILSGHLIHFTSDHAPYPQRIALTAAEEDYYQGASAPYIQADAMTFQDTVHVHIGAAMGSGPWHYVLNDDRGDHRRKYDGPFTIDHSCTVAVENPAGEGAPVVAHFAKRSDQRRITLESTYAPQYAAGGDQALVDGLRGGRDFRTGRWQGYQGQDVLASVDLGRVETVDSIGLGMLQDMGSWIWFPEQVDIAWSTNGRNWSSRKLRPNVDRRSDGGMTLDLWTGPLRKHARYIKIMAKNAGPCPDWHPGAGGSSWIFLDEVLIATAD
ncbi:MAG: glycoside hydrolase family 92 protein [Flavobacteriales bacterium]|nr:glycoside hydrolase family 92 protein [Flavobacteriales bacterium]